MITFDLYRFHIAPFSKEKFNLNLFTPYQVYVEQKNAIFREHLNSYLAEPSTYRKLPLTKKLIWEEGDWLCIKFGRVKRRAIHNAELEPDEIEEWPYVYLFINNHPGVQVVAVSENQNAFHSTSTVCGLFTRNLGQKLRRDQFELYFEPLFNRKNFWTFMERNRTQVRKIRFKLLTSGLSKLEENLKFDIKGLSTMTGAGRTTIELSATKGHFLSCDHENEILQSLVTYASEGGGDVRVSLRGIRREFSMADEKKTIRVEESMLEYPKELIHAHLSDHTMS